MSEDEKLTQEAPHPMPGLMTVFPIPQPKNDGSTEEAEPEIVQFGPFRVATGASADEGMIGGIVLELSEAPESVGPIPFSRGDTVFYFSDSSFSLNGYHLVPLNRAAAWLEAPGSVPASER